MRKCGKNFGKTKNARVISVRFFDPLIIDFRSAAAPRAGIVVDFVRPDRLADFGTGERNFGTIEIL